VERSALAKVVGGAAVAGGLLRTISTFLPDASVDPLLLQQTYFVTDFALLLGIGGYYAARATRLGAGGLIGFAIFLFGILLVRSNDVSFFGVHGYQTGAAIALIGIVALGAVAWRRTLARTEPLLWAAALAAGTAGALGIFSAPLVMAAGLLFGLGCIVAGLSMFREP
jgi:hypothetical protein